MNYTKLKEMITRCKWTFAKTMPFAPHEYIVKDKCPLTEEEFEYFVNMQREYGVCEKWGKYNHPYLYIDDYKYWTMGAPLEETTVINRAKACVINDMHQLYKGIKSMGKNQVEEYIGKQLALKAHDRGYNIELINGRLKEIADCVNHLEHMRTNYACEIMREWSEQLSMDFPDLKKIEDIRPDDVIYTGVTIPYNDTPDAIAIRIQIEKGKLYYGLTYMPATKVIRKELQEGLKFINDSHEFIKGQDWLYYKYVSFRDGYERLKELIERLILVSKT